MSRLSSGHATCMTSKIADACANRSTCSKHINTLNQKIPTPLLQATSRGHKKYSRCSNLFCETIADSLQCTPPVERSHHVRPHEIMTLSESISSNHRRISSIHTRDSRKAEMPGSLCQPIPQILGRMCPRYSLKTCPSVYSSFVGCDAVKDAD